MPVGDDVGGEVVAGGGDYVLSLKDNQPVLNKKVRALGLKMALSAKAKDGLVVIDTLELKDAKTKAFVRELIDAHYAFIWRLLSRLGVTADEVDDALEVALGAPGELAVGRLRQVGVHQHHRHPLELLPQRRLRVRPGHRLVGHRQHQGQRAGPELGGQLVRGVGPLVRQRPGCGDVGHVHDQRVPGRAVLQPVDLRDGAGREGVGAQAVLGLGAEHLVDGHQRY